jgi:hypothetical protein
MLILAHPEPGEECLVRIGPAREAIVSWNTRALDGALEVRVNAHDGRTSAWLPYAAFGADRRVSLEGRDTFARFETDVLRSDVDIVSLGTRSQGPLDALFVSTPDYGAPSPLAMLLAYRSFPVDVPVVAREVFDARYGGTGNWTFCTAFAGTLGFRAAVLHLRDLAHAHAFLADDIPLALSISWKAGELAGAPLPQSGGHLLVLRGIDENGDALVNDPAHPSIRTGYPRGAFERAWLGHGGVAFAVAPAPLGEALVRLANA